MSNSSAESLWYHLRSLSDKKQVIICSESPSPSDALTKQAKPTKFWRPVYSQIVCLFWNTTLLRKTCLRSFLTIFTCAIYFSWCLDMRLRRLPRLWWTSCTSQCWLRSTLQKSSNFITFPPRIITSWLLHLHHFCLCDAFVECFGRHLTCAKWYNAAWNSQCVWNLKIDNKNKNKNEIPIKLVCYMTFCSSTE